ncbi:MAG: hypothetical protein JO157_18525 [Acetobacteraceae bacterium]|nr:hypothetical protein [Acetobacteraceae bacterium]
MSAGDVLVVDPSELLALSATANRAHDQLDSVARAAGAIISGLDGRGWDIAAVQGRWASARGQFVRLEGDLQSQSKELTTRAELVAIFESGLGFGLPALGLLIEFPLPGGSVAAVLPMVLLGLDPLWAPLLGSQVGSVLGGPGGTASGIKGYQPFNLSALAENWFRGSGFQEKKLATYLSVLAGGSANMKRLAGAKGQLAESSWLSALAATAERAQQLAKSGNYAGKNHSKLSTLDKLDPTAGVTLQLLNANASVFNVGLGNKNASLSASVLAANAFAQAGLLADWKRRRLALNVNVGASANLADASVQANEHVGSGMLGAGGSVQGTAAVGANVQAQAGLTMDALKGKLKADLGADAFAGADATAQASTEADLAGAKAQVTGAVTGYAGAGIGLKADGTFDPLHGKFGFNLDGGVALGLGAKLDVGANVDLSDVPHEISKGATSVWHAITSIPDIFS